MSSLFLAVNDLSYIQNQFVDEIIKSPLVNGKLSNNCVVNDTLIRALVTNNADQVTIVGVANGHEESLFDLNGVIYITPDSWLKPEYKNIPSWDYKFIKASSIEQVSITATHELTDIFGVV